MRRGGLRTVERVSRGIATDPRSARPLRTFRQGEETLGKRSFNSCVSASKRTRRVDFLAYTADWLIALKTNSHHRP
ncbi:MAG: hypothetical protein AAF483_29395, partial [Planctomycetota bacterium]